MGSERASLCDAIATQLTAMYARRRRTTAHRSALHGISMAHYQVMLQLEELEELPMSRLAEGLDVSLPSMTGIVDRMEAHGLVERVRDSEDRRLVKVRLTASGGERLSETEAMRRDMIERVLAHLGGEQLERLCAAITDLTQAFAAAAACGDIEPWTADHPTAPEKETIAP